MSAALAVTIASEVLSLAGTALEAAQAGREDEAMELLTRARDRCQAANEKWEAAAKPGDEGNPPEPAAEAPTLELVEDQPDASGSG